MQINLQDVLDSPTPRSLYCAKLPVKSLILMEYMNCNNVNVHFASLYAKR